MAAYFCLCGLLIKLNFWREWRKQTEEDVKFNFTTLMLTAGMRAVNRMWPYDLNTEVPVAQWVWRPSQLSKPFKNSMFYYGRAHYRVSYKSFYRYGIHFLGIGTTIVQLSLCSSGKGWKLQSHKPGDVYALFRLWYLADYLAYFFLISHEFFHFTCCSNDAKCIGKFVFHVLFPTGASKVNRLAREMI